MKNIKKFESFEIGNSSDMKNWTVKNSSDVKNWSADYHVNKEKGYIPVAIGMNGFEEVPAEKYDYRYKNYYWIDSTKLDELNNKRNLYIGLEKEFKDFFKSIQV